MMLQCIVPAVPVSINASYATNVIRLKKPVRTKTGKLKTHTSIRHQSKALDDFKKLFDKQSICIYDGPTKTTLKDFLHEIQSKKLCLIVQVYFKKERLFTKDGRIKKLDISNRIKSCEDCLCNSIGIDDSQIFRVVAEKCVTDFDEQTVISLMRHP